MLLALAAVVVGLALLVWSADRFVDGASATARYAGMPSLLIGMVIIGFGTSAPEMVVSAIAAAQGNPGLALGNAYGSNIANIALILGVVALISAITVHSQVVRKELPILGAVTLLAAAQLWDGELGRLDAVLMLSVFAAILGWSIYQGTRKNPDNFADDTNSEIDGDSLTKGKAIFWLIAGLVLLIVASQILVWGAVTTAKMLGVSDLVIGLTIVAVGTSLPELASSLAAIRKNEHDLALGNVIGSNFFNTLVVVGIASAIEPIAVPPEVLYRDWSIMAILTLMLFVMCFGFKRPGKITRANGAILFTCFVGYTAYLVVTNLKLS